MVSVSIIVCTYNREALLKNCLDALIEQLPKFSKTTEVIVVDNNCVDGTEVMVKRLCAEYAWLKYVKETKQGLSNARNCGAQYAEGEYLCYLDDDGKPSENYLFNLYEMLRAKLPDIAGGPIYPYYTSKPPWWFKDEFEIRKHAEFSGYKKKSNISGGNFIIRAQLLRQLGMFSPRYGMVGNKTRLGDEKAVLLSYRSSRPVADQRVYYSLKCFIYHHVPTTKMRFSYFIKRGFFSGVSLVQIKKKNAKHLPGFIKEFYYSLFIDFIPMLLTGARRDGDHPVLAMQRSALAMGKIMEVVRCAIIGGFGKQK